MRTSGAAVALAAGANAASLADVCTVSNVQSALPSNGTLLGINLIPSAVTASPLYNSTSSGIGGMVVARAQTTPTAM
jgi:tannase